MQASSRGFGRGWSVDDRGAAAQLQRNLGKPLLIGCCGILIQACGADAGVDSGSGVWGSTQAALSSNELGSLSPIDSSVVSRVGRDWSFYYSGANAAQVGVTSGSVDAIRAGVISGRVQDASGAPLAGVSVALLGHPELGSVASRADGSFDLVANGGGPLVLSYQLAGFLSAQRQVRLDWGGYAAAPDVALLAPDVAVSALASGSAVVQVARGSIVTDAAGSRQATLIVPAGANATLVANDGSTQPLAQIHVHGTESSVGTLGPNAAVGTLPPASAYTVAIEWSAEEAPADGSSRVDLSPGASLYVENFRSLPVGTALPAGYYDRARGQWVASGNGRVLRVIDSVNGVARIDADGDGSPDSDAALTALGISSDERRQLAALYAAGTSLWRVPVTHLAPWSFALPSAAVAGACAPGPSCEGAEPPGAPALIDPCSLERTADGACPSQVLRRSIALAGTPFTLVYASDRAPGYKADDTLEIPVTANSALPAAATSVEIEIGIAGRVFRQSFGTAPGQSYTFTWDGTDQLGRALRGAHVATVRRGLRYGALYQQPGAAPESFGQVSGLSLAGQPGAPALTLWTVNQRQLGGIAPIEPGLGGWSLNIEHAYDPLRHVVVRGDGSVEAPGFLFGESIVTEAGTGTSGAGADGPDARSSAFSAPGGLAVAADGSVYVADTANNRVRRIAPDGSVATLQATGSPYNLLINGSNDAPITTPNQVPGWTSVSGGNWRAGTSNPAPFDGSQYFFAGVSAQAELRQDVDVSGYGWAIDAGLQRFSFEGYVQSFAQSPFDTSRIVVEYRDASNAAVLGTYDSGQVAQSTTWQRLADTRTAPAGTRTIRVRLIATRNSGNNNDGYFDALSLKAESSNVALLLNGPRGLALGPDGSLYVAETNANRVQKVDPHGIASVIAGTGQAGFGGDGGPAARALLGHPAAVAVGADGALYIADADNFRIRRVSTSGTISTFAGTGAAGNAGTSGSGGPAIQAALGGIEGLAVAADGSVLFSERSLNRVRSIGTDGIVRVFAGTGTAGFAGDGAMASAAQLSGPAAISAAPDGRVFIADAGNQRLRVVGTDGRITSLAGTGTAGFSGEGGPGLAARLNAPSALAVGPDGALHVADTGNQRIRRVCPSLPGFATGDTLVASANGNEVYRFDADGRHLATLNGLTGAPLYSFGYDTNQRLVSVTDASGRVTELMRNVAGSVVAIGSPYGQRTTLAMSPQGYLQEVIDPEGGWWQFKYGSDGLMSEATDANGAVSSLSYDALGRLTQAVDATGAPSAWARTNLSGTESTLTQTSALGRTNLLDVQRLADRSEQLGTLLADGSQSVRLHRPDGTGRTTLPDRTQLSFSASPDARFGMALPVTSLSELLPSGLQSVTTRTSQATLGTPSDPFSVTGTSETRVVNGRTYRTDFDAASSRFTMTSPAGRKSFRSVDRFGRTTRVEQDGLTPIDFVYDGDGRLASVSHGARSTSFEYFTDGSANGFLSGCSDALGQFLETDRDGLGRAIRLADDGGSLGLTWDPVGNLVSLAPPGRPAYALNYTAENQLASVVPPPVDSSDPSTSYAYDADGALILESRPGGVQIARTYDGAGRLSQELAASGSITHSYYAGSASAAGSAPGRLSELDGPGNVQLTYTYDGRLTTSRALSGDVNGSVSWSYDANFVVVRQNLSAPGGTATTAYGYDADLLLTCVSPTSCSPAGAGALSFTRNARHGLLEELTQGTLDESWSYTSLGELASQTLRTGNTMLFALSYDDAAGPRDALGRVTRTLESSASGTHDVEYAYDLSGHLSDVSTDGVLTEHYEYDLSDNRVVAQTPAGTVNASYDLQDRLESYGVLQYTYTPNGELFTKTNTSTGEVTGYTYDAFGSLAAVDLPDGHHIDYVNDGRGRRVGKKIDGVLVQAWLYGSGSSPLAELDGSGQLRASFAYGSRSNVPDYMQRADGSLYRILSDSAGSVRLVVNINDASDVLLQARYSAFGERTLELGLGDALPFGFAGGLQDPDTGLIRLGARDLDPEIGRWTTKAPGQHDASTPNLYVYAGSDPINGAAPAGDSSSNASAAAARAACTRTSGGVVPVP